MRPSRPPSLLAELEAAAPARVVKRVRDAPAMAEAWMWRAGAAVVEVVADDVTVTITPSPFGITCTCLLAPKCVHILAVTTALPEATPEATPDVGADPDGLAGTEPAPGTVGGVPAPSLPAGEPAPGAAARMPAPAAAPATARPDASPTSPATPDGTAPPARSASSATPERAAALAALATLDLLLRLGAHGADAGVRAELARAAYEARSVGLHRLARALARIVRSLRLHAAGHPTFALASLSEEVVEALDVARRLAAAPTGAASAALVGEARRTYVPAGTLRLWGLCSEPVLAAGNAGVVTWLVDTRGRLFEVPDVRPRAAGQAAGVYDVAPPIASLPHRALGREGLFVQGATAADGRLGAGAGVAAVRSAGASWDTAPLDALWATAPSASAAPGAPPAGRPAAGRPPAADPATAGALRFVEGCVAGRWRDALVLLAEGGAPIFVIPGSEHASLPWRDNLTLLARAPGLALRLVGRDVPGRPRTVVGIAMAPAIASPEGTARPAPDRPLDASTSTNAPAEPHPSATPPKSTLLLPAAWAGRVNLGLDRLTTAHLPHCAPAPLNLQAVVATSDPLAPLRRRVARALLGGVASLPGEATTEVARDGARLRAAMAGAGADLLAALAGAARRPEGFATAWLASARYLAVADAERARRAW